MNQIEKVVIWRECNSGDDGPSSKCLTWAKLSIFFHQLWLSSGFSHPNIIRCYSRKKSFFMVGWGDFIFFFLLCFGRNVDIICAALSELWILPSQKLLRVSFHRSKIREHLPPATWKMKLAHTKMSDCAQEYYQAPFEDFGKPYNDSILNFCTIWLWQTCQSIHGSCHIHNFDHNCTIYYV